MRKIISLVLLFLCLFSLFSCSDSVTVENSSANEIEEIENDENGIFVVNTKTKKYHITNCSSAREISEEYRRTTSDVAYLNERGYSPCARCIMR